MALNIPLCVRMFQSIAAVSFNSSPRLSFMSKVIFAQGRSKRASEPESFEERKFSFFRPNDHHCTNRRVLLHFQEKSRRDGFAGKSPSLPVFENFIITCPEVECHLSFIRVLSSMKPFQSTFSLSPIQPTQSPSSTFASPYFYVLPSVFRSEARSQNNTFLNNNFVCPLRDLKKERFETTWKILSHSASAVLTGFFFFFYYLCLGDSPWWMDGSRRSCGVLFCVYART